MKDTRALSLISLVCWERHALLADAGHRSTTPHSPTWAAAAATGPGATATTATTATRTAATGDIPSPTTDTSLTVLCILLRIG
jgi:hypothetical protein